MFDVRHTIMKRKQVLIINGSIRGDQGNSGAIVRKAAGYLDEKNIAVSILTLADPMPSIKEVRQQLEGANALLLISGVYWHNYSSLLQRFIEVMTVYENSPVFFGKPVGCALSMDSVGGGEVAARLLSVFVNLGCWTPPCSTVILSRVGTEAITASQGTTGDPNEDVWRMDDLNIVMDNLIASTDLPSSIWHSWPHVKLINDNDQWPDNGPLNLQTPRFL